MRVLKIVYFFFGLWFVASAILGVREIHSGHEDMGHAVFRTISSIFVAAFCGAAIYGIHKKAPIAWKLGWGVIGAGLLEFLVSALSALSKSSMNDHPAVADAVVSVMGAAVALYWGIWWNRQRAYFVKPASTNKPQE